MTTEHKSSTGIASLVLGPVVSSMGVVCSLPAFRPDGFARNIRDNHDSTREIGLRFSSRHIVKEQNGQVVRRPPAKVEAHL